MAITSGQITVGLTPVMVDGLHQMPYRIFIKNLDDSADAFLGNQDVTISTGYRISKGEIIQLVVNPLDTVWAVANKTDHKMCFLRETL